MHFSDFKKFKLSGIDVEIARLMGKKFEFYPSFQIEFDQMKAMDKVSLTAGIFVG